MSITAERISKRFGAFVALDGVDLEVPSGELVALLGPSGSGKTTLLRIIAGLERPDAGSGPIRFRGEDVADRAVGERRVGFVFQHYALFRHMNVFENVAFGLRVQPRRIRPAKAEIAERVRRLLSLVQLEAFADRFPAQLSGGQRQRIALARALAVEPKVLLLDEPFGSLDAKVRVELRRWLRRLHDEIHLTSVLVTHDQDEALEVADRVVLMNRGRVEQVGPPAEVYDAPATEFVYRFLGSVNRFRARVRGGHAFVDGTDLGAVHAPDGDGDVVGYARPHEIDLARVPGERPALGARVLAVAATGPFARVELEHDGEPVEVMLPRDRYDDLAPVTGEALLMVPRRLRFLPADAPEASAPAFR